MTILVRKKKDLVNLSLEDQQKILEFEYGENAHPDWMRFIFNNSNSAIRSYSQNYENDPVLYHEPGTLQDPLSSYHKTLISDLNSSRADIISIHRSYTALPKLYVLVKSRMVSADRSDIEEVKERKLKAAIRKIFNAYKLACKFYTPSIYDEDSSIFKILQDISKAKPGESLKLEGGTEEDPVTYDFESWGLTEQEITDPKKLIERATELGVLHLYSIGDYTESTGYEQFVTDSEIIVPVGSSVHFLFELNPEYFDAIPTKAEINNSWIYTETRDRPRDPWVNPDGPPETARQEYYHNSKLGQYMATKRGEVLMCMVGASYGDVDCEQELEEMDVMGIGGLMDADEEALRKRYPTMARNYDHLKEKYGTMAKALADPDTAGELLKNAGLQMMKLEAKNLHKQLLKAAFRNNMTAEYGQAGDALVAAMKAGAGKANGGITYPINKFDLHVSTVIDAFKKFDGQLEDFKAQGGYIKTADTNLVYGLDAPNNPKTPPPPNDAPPHVKEAYDTLLDAWRHWHYMAAQPETLNVRYIKSINWAVEGDRLKMGADRLKSFIQANVNYIHNKISKSKHPKALEYKNDTALMELLGNKALFLPGFAFGSGAGADIYIEFGVPGSNVIAPVVQIVPPNGLDISVRLKNGWPNTDSASSSILQDYIDAKTSVTYVTEYPKSAVCLRLGNKFINLGLGFGGFGHPAGQGIGDLVKTGMLHRPTTMGFLRYVKEIYTKINDFSLCTAPVPGAAMGISGLKGPAATPAGLALDVAANFLYPYPDPKGFAAAVKGSLKTAAKGGLTPGSASALPFLKGLKKDAEWTMKSTMIDVENAMKAQAAKIRSMLPPGDPRCFDWEYIKSVIYRNWNWRNLVCKIFECLGIPVPIPFPWFSWPGWPDLWPPQFPWPPKNPLADIWELIKAIILALLCALITMILDLLKVDCDLYDMVTEEFLIATGLDDDFNKMKQDINDSPALAFIRDLAFGPPGPASEEDIRARIGDELKLGDSCGEEEDTPALGTLRTPLTSANYDPMSDLADLIHDLHLILNPREFCELLGGTPSQEGRDLTMAMAHERYPNLEAAFDYNEERLISIIGIVGEETIGTALCAALAYAPDMVTPPAQVCHQPGLREKLLSGRLNEDDLTTALEKEKEQKHQFLENIIKNGAATGNIFTGNGLDPLSFIGGTSDSLGGGHREKPNIVVPMYDDFAMDFKKEMIEGYFKPIKQTYNSDIELFTEYLTDKLPTKAEVNKDPTPPGEISEKEESLLFKQMMDNPYSGFYRSYDQVVAALGEQQARGLRYLHFFRPSDGTNPDVVLTHEQKKLRSEKMFMSWHKNMALGGVPGQSLPEKEVAKRLKELLTNSSLIETEKDETGNFYVVLKFPNIILRKDIQALDVTANEVDTGGSIIYDSTPGIYCSTDFRYVEDSYKISFNGPFFTGGGNAEKVGIETFTNTSRLPKSGLKSGDPIHQYFTEKLKLNNNELLQPYAFAELLAINTETMPVIQDAEASVRYLHARDDLFFETALDAYNEMEQYIFESFGRFLATSDMINPLDDGAIFPRGNKDGIMPSDIGRAGIEIMGRSLNPLYDDQEPPCPIPGFMDWDSVKEKVISQVGALLTEGLGDEPTWPSPLQYSIATAGFLNSWIRLEIVQIVLEGLPSFYEFGLTTLDEEVMLTFIMNRIKARNQKHGVAFADLFERLAVGVLRTSGVVSGTEDKPVVATEKSRPNQTKGFDKFDIKQIETEEENPFNYNELRPMVKNNIDILKGKITKLISAPENIYDGFYETFPSLDLFKNIKIVFDHEANFAHEDPEGAKEQTRILYSRSGDETGGYKPQDENQIFKPTFSPRSTEPTIRDEYSDIVGDGSFVFQKYIKFVPNELEEQTAEGLRKALSQPGSATDVDNVRLGLSFLDENPRFYPDAIPLADFKAFVEGLGGPPPEEEGDMEWWAEHFASRRATGHAEEFPAEDETPYPENTYINEFSSNSKRKKLAELVLAKLTSPPHARQEWTTVPGTSKGDVTPEGNPHARRAEGGGWRSRDGRTIIQDAEGLWLYQDQSLVVDTPYYSKETPEGAEGSSWVSRFMNPTRVLGPDGRQELDKDQLDGYGNYINDEVTARTAEGGRMGSSQSSVRNRMFLDFWQIPESLAQINEYEVDYENLWIPARFEVVEYKYKELPRFIHGSTDLYKDRQGAIQTLQEMATSLEAVKYKHGPWDAILRDYTRYPGEDTSYAFMGEYHFWYEYPYKSAKHYFMNHFEFTTYTGDPVPMGYPPSTPLVAGSQTWKSCIDRGLTMIANWPTMEKGTGKDLIENADNPFEGVRSYSNYIVPYSSHGPTGGAAAGMRDVFYETTSMSHLPVMKERREWSLWWFDLATLICNEFDRDEVFTPLNGHAGAAAGRTVSPLSEMLSFYDEEKEIGGGVGENNKFHRYMSSDSTDPTYWYNWKRNFQQADKGGYPGIFRGKFEYVSVYVSGHRYGNGTGQEKGWNYGNRYRPDIWPPIVQKYKTGEYTRMAEHAHYRLLAQKDRPKADRMIQEARLLLEARDKYNLSIDPSTLDERGKSLYGYYEKFLLQRLRMPFQETEMYRYGWVHQRTFRHLMAPLKVWSRSGAHGYAGRYPTQGFATYNHHDRGFSYEQYNLPSSPENWTIFMKQVDELIEYVKNTPKIEGTKEDTAVTISEKTNIDKQYVVHFVNAKAVFSGILRNPQGADPSASRDVFNVRPLEQELDLGINPGSPIDSDSGGFSVIRALMDPNAPGWPAGMPSATKARLIRDNVKSTARSGPGALDWWKKLMKIWAFKGQAYWKTEYTTELVGETRFDSVEINREDRFLGMAAPETQVISDRTAERATLHPVGGEVEDNGFYLWSRTYQVVAREAWLKKMKNDTAWFYDPMGLTVDSNNNFFFTWADEDIQIDKTSPRAVTKYITKNKLCERLLDVGFEDEAMWFGDESPPIDMSSEDGPNPFWNTNDRPFENYWVSKNKDLTKLLDFADFGRMAGAADRSFSDFNRYKSNIDEVKAFFAANQAMNSRISIEDQFTRGGASLRELYDAATSNFAGRDSLLNPDFSVTQNLSKLKLHQLSVVDFWPEDCASDNNPYSWHRDYIFYNGFRKTNSVISAQRNNRNLDFITAAVSSTLHGDQESANRFYSSSAEMHDGAMSLVRAQVAQGFALGIHNVAAADDENIQAGSIQHAPAGTMINFFLPRSDKSEIYVPSPFGIHPNLALYRYKYTDDAANQFKQARPDTPVAKRQLWIAHNDSQDGKLTAAHANGSQLYTATKTLVRKRVKFVINKPEYEKTSSLAKWHFGASNTPEGQRNWDIDPERIEAVRAAVSYFDNNGLGGKEQDSYLAHQNPEEGADSSEKNTEELMKICREIEAENFLAFTFMRMWQARKHYLLAYAEWAEVEVVEAFERLTTSIANCNMHYGSRLIYLPKIEEGADRFGGWSQACGFEGDLSPQPITNAAHFRKYLNEESSHVGLEVVGPSNDQEAIQGNKITDRHTIVPIPYVPLLQREAPLAISDLVKIDKATKEELQALGFSDIFADLVSKDGGLPLVRFLTEGDQFVEGAFPSSLLPPNANDREPVMNVQDYLIDQIKNSPESELLFKYLFPLKRYASTFTIYNISATSSLYKMDQLFGSTREKLLALLKLSIDVPYDKFPSQAADLGIMSPELYGMTLKKTLSMTNMEGMSALKDIIKAVVMFPPTLAAMILTLTDPFYQEGVDKMRACNLKHGLSPKSFAVPFKDNNKQHQMKPFTLYPPIPFAPPILYGPMGLLYDYEIDGMASPIGPALFSIGGLPGDEPKVVCAEAAKGANDTGAVKFGPVGPGLFVKDVGCEDDE